MAFTYTVLTCDIMRANDEETDDYLVWLHDHETDDMPEGLILNVQKRNTPNDYDDLPF